MARTLSNPNKQLLLTSSPADDSFSHIPLTMRQVLAWARQQFDYVLIDSSPVFAADDTATLAPMVDGTLFVVRNRFSRPRPAREALELLFQRQAKVLGLVFNRADASARSHYY